MERRWVGAVNESQLVTSVDELVAAVAPSGEADGKDLEGVWDFAHIGRANKFEQEHCSYPP